MRLLCRRPLAGPLLADSNSISLFFAESISMEIQILARNIDLTDAQNEFIERRVQYALCRFSTEVRTVQVTISDINGPRGGTDVLCRVKLVLKKKGEVLAGDTDASVEAAIANVADRAARSLARQLDRQRDHQGTSMSGSVLR